MVNRSALHHPAATIWAPLGLMLVVLGARVLSQQGFLPNLNLSPLMAFAFVGAIVVPRPLPWWSWAVILLTVDVLSQGATVWHPENLPAIALTYACYVAAAWWGGHMRNGAGVWKTLGGTVACSVLFYLITNTLCWATESIYTKTFAGWMQCLVYGTPGYPETWRFFLHSLTADLIGATVLLVAYNGEAVVRGLRTLPWVSGRSAPLATA